MKDGAAFVGLVRSSSDTWTFGRSFGASGGGAVVAFRFSRESMSFGGSAGGAATLCGKESMQLGIAGLTEEDSKPGAL